MKFDTVAALRETLERMETQQLDTMLHEELRKEQPDGQLIRLIGSVLRERERDTLPEITPEIQKAWEQYQEKTNPQQSATKRVRTYVVRAASLILVLLTLAALLPKQAEAMNIFERFIAWTSDVFSLLNPSERGKQEDAYEFRTDNPGLQQVYDKVTELGVTVPVVPSWLPEGYELVEFLLEKAPNITFITATFSNGIADVVYQLDIYNNNTTSAYSKDENVIRVFEMNGIEHTLINNNELLVAVWAVENLECTIVIDCQENVLKQILKSIYTMGQLK